MKALTPAAGAALGLLAAVVAAAWLAVLLAPGAPEEMRAQFQLAFEPEPAHAAGALELAAHNLKICGLALLAAATQLLYATSPGARRLARWLSDPLLVLSYTLNAAQFGLALGAYGDRLLAWTPHVPLELAALALGAGAYLRARRGVQTGRELAAAAAGCALLVSIAAIIETWGVPHT